MTCISNAIYKKAAKKNETCHPNTQFEFISSQDNQLHRARL